MGDYDLIYVKKLMENSIPESRVLEFKRELWGTSDGDKKEMLKDVSALANTDGGLIIVGVEEQEGIITEIIGIEVDDIDATVDRLNQSIMTAIEPKITGLDISYVDCKDGKFLIMIDIPKSWLSPHMVTYKRSARFYKRTSTNVYQLGVQEIRDEFLMTENVNQRIVNFRFDRYNLINNRERFPTLRYPACLVVQSIPMSSFMGKRDYFEVRKEVGKDTNLPSLSSTKNPGRYNFDGMLGYAYDSPGKLREYTQFFRNGTFELVSHYPLVSRKNGAGNRENYIASEIFVNYLTQGVHSTVSYQEKLGCSTPIILFIGLLNVSGYCIALNGGMSYPIENENLYLPELIIDNFPKTRQDTHELLGEMLNMIWNAGGVEYS